MILYRDDRWGKWYLVGRFRGKKSPVVEKAVQDAIRRNEKRVRVIRACARKD